MSQTTMLLPQITTQQKQIITDEIKSYNYMYFQYTEESIQCQGFLSHLLNIHMWREKVAQS